MPRHFGVGLIAPLCFWLINFKLYNKLHSVVDSPYSLGN